MRVSCFNCRLFGNGCPKNKKLSFEEGMSFYCEEFRPEKEEDSVEILLSDMIYILREHKK